MKNLLLILTLAFSSLMMKAQIDINYSGNLTNNSSSSIMMILEIDSVMVDTTFTNSAGIYSDSIAISAQPSMIRILFFDCNGNLLSDWFSPSGTQIRYTINFTTMNYCTPVPPAPCNASFSIFQAIDSSTYAPIPNEVILVDSSTGSGLSYSWDFGDGSAPVSGLNVIHTYATHGSYLVCLTVTSGTGAGSCTSTFCDTLTVDPSGNIRAAFTVRTGNAKLSIEENSTINSLKLFPNPANEFAIVEFESVTNTNISVKIIDVRGSEIQVENRAVFSGNNRIRLNTTNLKEGLYIIILQDEVGMTTKRLQIRK